MLSSSASLQVVLNVHQKPVRFDRYSVFADEELALDISVVSSIRVTVTETELQTSCWRCLYQCNTGGG